MTESSITRRDMTGGLVAGAGLAMAAASNDLVGSAHAQSASKTVGINQWKSCGAN